MEGRREDRAQVMLEADFEAHHNRDPYFRTIEFHAHDFLELYLFLDGSVTYYIEDQVYDLCPGDLLVIPPGRMHRPVIANEHAAYERMVLWVELDYIARIDGAAGELQAALRGVGPNGYCVPFRGDDLIFAVTLFKRIVEMHRSGADGVFTASAIRLYLRGVFEAYSLVEKQAQGETAVIPQVIRYLTAHFREPLTLEALARALGVSRFHLSHVFSEKIGQGFSAYLASIRVDCACALLAGTNRSVTEIAAESGFESQRSFFRAFGARCGMTPLAYRRRAQGTQAQK